MADAVLIRDDDFPVTAGRFQFQAGPSSIQFGNHGAEGLFELRGRCAGFVFDIEGRFVVLLGALLDQEVASSAAHQGVEGVARTGRGLESPQRSDPGMNAAQRVGDFAVGIDFEGAVGADVILEVVRVMV